MSEPTNNKKTSEITDPRLRFLQYCRNFPIDLFDIPRPLKSGRKEINDETCVLVALSLLCVPHEMCEDDYLEPIGWLMGPHLLDIERYEDYSLGFCDEPLISILKENPWLLVIESPVQLAVAILRTRCNNGNPRESKFAKTILRNLGLNFLLPEASRKKRTESLSLRFYQNRPEILSAAVILYEDVIRDYLEKRYEVSYAGVAKKEYDISIAFGHIFNRNLPEDLFFEGERDRDITSIALAFIHYETGAPYESLYKLYYSTKNELKLSDVLNQRGGPRNSDR